MLPLADGGAGSRWDVDFWVDDADVTCARAAELGGRVLVSHDRPPFRSAVLADPEGAAYLGSRLLA